MGDYWVPITEILVNAGCQVHVDDSNAGYETRSRSSGGFNGPPLAVQWHHTASSASVDNDLSYMIHGSPDEPVGNVLLARDGVFHPVAAGAANTSGKGGPNTFSRGTVAKDSGNTSIFSIEIANNGVGERYTQVQIDAAFLASNALNAYFGNQPDDVIPHSIAEGTGYTDRKIDPATNNVEGPWLPRSVNSSKTWSHADLKAECLVRAGTRPPPIDTGQPPSLPTPDPEEDEVPAALLQANDGSHEQQAAVFWWDGKQIGWIPTGTAVDVGIVCGLYINSQPPLSNFSVGEIQALINVGWAGGPMPAGFNPPSAVDSSVT